MCNILLKWIEVADKPFGSKALDDEEISFGFEERLVTINLDNIICVLKGNDVIHNVVNIFLKWTPLEIPGYMWIAFVSFMNVLWSL